jgi:hypothetical protein
MTIGRPSCGSLLGVLDIMQPKSSYPRQQLRYYTCTYGLYIPPKLRFNRENELFSYLSPSTFWLAFC